MKCSVTFVSCSALHLAWAASGNPFFNRHKISLEIAHAFACNLISNCKWLFVSVSLSCCKLVLYLEPWLIHNSNNNSNNPKPSLQILICLFMKFWCSCSFWASNSAFFSLNSNMYSFALKSMNSQYSFSKFSLVASGRLFLFELNHSLKSIVFPYLYHVLYNEL